MKAEHRKQALWIARGVLTIILIGFVLWAWPGYLAHERFVSQTSSVHHESTDVFPAYGMAEQHFIPQKTYLAGIQFAAYFEEQSVENEEAIFLLCDESGKEIFSSAIKLDEMVSGSYYEVKFGRWLKTDQEYCWKIVGPAAADVNFQLMYTNHVEDQAPENTLFILNGNQVGENTQTVSQYVYFIHPDKVIVIGGYWMGSVLVYIICMDILTRIFRGK